MWLWKWFGGSVYDGIYSILASGFGLQFTRPKAKCLLCKLMYCCDSVLRLEVGIVITSISYASET